jgi:hypothetical protein
MHMSFLESWLTKITYDLNLLGSRGAFKKDWLTDGSWNKQSWLHARMLGVLIRSIEHPLIPMVEMRWHRHFKPDICIANEQEEIIAVIEYESTNSSDERLMDKDILHYRDAILSYKGYENYKGDPSWIIPEWWLIISSLPDCSVRGWPWWKGYNEETYYPPKLKSKAQRDQNPLKYYEAGLHLHLNEAWKYITKEFGEPPPCKLVWVNITTQSIDVMNINGKKLATSKKFLLNLI